MHFSSPKYFEKMIHLGYVPSTDTQDNADVLLRKVNDFIDYLFREKLLPNDYLITLASGWRSIPFNESIGGAKNSAHCQGRAIDLGPDNLIIKICEKDPAILEKFNLYGESSMDTATWSHIQSIPPKSQHRVFRA